MCTLRSSIHVILFTKSSLTQDRSLLNIQSLFNLIVLQPELNHENKINYSNEHSNRNNNKKEQQKQKNSNNKQCDWRTTESCEIKSQQKESFNIT